MRSACARALYRTGRADEALTRYPESRPMYADRLIRMGAYDSVITRFPDQLARYGLACALAKRYGDIPYRTGTWRVSSAVYTDLLHIEVMQRWADGDRPGARRAAALPHVFSNFGVDKTIMRFGEFLLLPALEGLAGDTASMARQCRRIAAEHADRMNACLRHEALYLAGDIGDSAFLAQPYGYDVQDRFRFFKALRLDLEGRASEARAAYRVMPDVSDHQFLANPFAGQSHQLLESSAVQRFAAWRIEELSGGK